VKTGVLQRRTLKEREKGQIQKKWLMFLEECTASFSLDRVARMTERTARKNPQDETIHRVSTFGKRKTALG